MAAVASIVGLPGGNSLELTKQTLEPCSGTTLIADHGSLEGLARGSGCTRLKS